MNECTILLSPANGAVSFPDMRDIGSVAEYTCISEHFRLVPRTSQRRTCGENSWDGVDPRCGE